MQGPTDAEAADEAVEAAADGDPAQGTLRRELRRIAPVLVALVALVVISQAIRSAGRGLGRRVSRRHPVAGIGEQLLIGRLHARR